MKYKQKHSHSSLPQKRVQNKGENSTSGYIPLCPKGPFELFFRCTSPYGRLAWEKRPLERNGAKSEVNLFFLSLAKFLIGHSMGMYNGDIKIKACRRYWLPLKDSLKNLNPDTFSLNGAAIAYLEVEIKHLPVGKGKISQIEFYKL